MSPLFKGQKLFCVRREKFLTFLFLSLFVNKIQIMWAFLQFHLSMSAFSWSKVQLLDVIDLERDLIAKVQVRCFGTIIPQQQDKRTIYLAVDFVYSCGWKY